MNESVSRDIFKAIYENKWLSIEYKNKDEGNTKYWIGIKKINPLDRSMIVEGLHLGKYQTMELKIFIDSIQSAALVDGTYFETEESLKEDISINPLKYQGIFHSVTNLKILNYLSMCNRLDGTPYKTEYALIDHLDGTTLKSGLYRLSDEQFQEIVSNFQANSKNQGMNLRIKQLGMNELSIYTNQGLYVLAYRKLRLDVKNRKLFPEKEVTICTEFTINGTKQSIRKFLDADDYGLLADFEGNRESIKDSIMRSNANAYSVDDRPYVLAVGMNVILDLQKEYAEIVKSYEEDRVTVPVKAFFGELVKPPISRKDYPIALLNRKINLDQLLAIHNAMKYPLAYIQGPPGTGKTNTIVNTIITAFFNERTVLFTSYNNHPIDGVCEKLQKISYRGKGFVPFPIIRLGNDEKVGEALDTMKLMYERSREITIFEGTLERNKDERIERTKALTALLKRHEEKLDLLERKEAIDVLWHENQQYLNFQTQLEGVQKKAIEQKLQEVGEITDEEALRYVLSDEEEFTKYLYYTSAKYIKRLGDQKNEELLQIIYHPYREERVKKFNDYLKKPDNVKKFLRIFPIVATTSISAHKVGEPKTYFDMTIMDEASQGNIAVSLVPVIRGKSLMLVGDPQQLNPVILLDEMDNTKLKKAYEVPEEYDYIKNSIYKTFLACDAVSGEILLSHHYRCAPKIIGFNNKKYYNNKLVIDSGEKGNTSLLFWDVPGNTTNYKNTAPLEAQEIVRFASLNKDKSIGVITPFVNQKEYINALLKEEKIENVTCGTVHAFQGDEKDVVLFSLALTDRTSVRTYDWLKNNKELINVATSRAKEQLVLVSSNEQLQRLHSEDVDDIYELVQYVKAKGKSEVTPRVNASRALGIKPYSTETEKAFLETLNHALGNVLYTNKKCNVKKEVSIAQIFNNNTKYNDLFYTGRFDFVVFERDVWKNEIPILAIELDGKEHYENEVVMERDKKKNEICKRHGFELIRVENSYARRYEYIKEILEQYFRSVRAL